MPTNQSIYKWIINLLKEFDKHIIKIDKAKTTNDQWLILYYTKEIEDFKNQINTKFEKLNQNQAKTKDLKSEFEKIIYIYNQTTKW